MAQPISDRLRDVARTVPTHAALTINQIAHDLDATLNQFMAGLTKALHANVMIQPQALPIVGEVLDAMVGNTSRTSSQFRRKAIRRIAREILAVTDADRKAQV